MGKITGAANTTFKSANYVYAKIKRDLSSFVAAGLIDDSEFPIYTMQVLEKLGNAVFMEDEAILEVNNYKAKLPSNLHMLHSAYKCNQCGTSSTRMVKNFQREYIIEDDITCEVVEKYDNCCHDKVIQKIHVKQYVNDCLNDFTYNNFTLLRLSPNVKEKCVEKCLNMFATTNQEINIEGDTVLTNFEHGFIFLKYFSTPLDEEGIPKIIDNTDVASAVEWYIKYQIFLNMWFNSDAADTSNKYQKAEQEYEKFMAEARYYVKLPSFATMMNAARNKRVYNGVNYFSQIDNKR